ncbi:hypothetical protein FJ656_28350 [Schumannella luteola]|uniref:Uncharacterized protein n=1 Tax=Schumannella luteola TaxID=472059 RepID=A0A852YL53_9MICO|nr:hypothetical protein [Schumannella luteola]NYG98469.1 hypothetical protein [Schumannella luteola]TPX01305.1 hypothetical protein FJ656_28350 [Schumannella luteola]
MRFTEDGALEVGRGSSLLRGSSLIDLASGVARHDDSSWSTSTVLSYPGEAGHGMPEIVACPLNAMP